MKIGEIVTGTDQSQFGYYSEQAKTIKPIKLKPLPSLADTVREPKQKQPPPEQEKEPIPPKKRSRSSYKPVKPKPPKNPV